MITREQTFPETSQPMKNGRGHWNTGAHIPRMGPRPRQRLPLRADVQHFFHEMSMLRGKVELTRKDGDPKVGY